MPEAFANFITVEEQFLEFIQKNQLIRSGDRILLAVSGGLDSMVMLDLFKHQNWHVEVAHCNFKLRDEASDADEDLVRRVTQKHGFTFHCKHFDTTQISTSTGKGIQETARELRYKWFREIIEVHNLDLIATAHHADDQIETALMHLVRGSGLAGLIGMLPRRGKIIRPLLFAHRSDLEKYAGEHATYHQEDESNLDIKYRRNFLRHAILPLLREMNPNFNQRMIENMEHWGSAKKVLEEHVLTCLENRKSSEDNITKLRFLQDDSRDLKSQIIYHWLYDFGFSGQQLNNIAEALASNRTGAQFLTEKHTIIINRGEIHLRRHTPSQESILLTKSNNQIQTGEGILSYSLAVRGDINLSEPGPNSEYLDAEQIEFPLTMQRWQPGDYFYPLGLSGRQKLKKYLSDNKLSQFEKESVWLLKSQGKICWIVGMRIDERFKVTSQTTHVLKLKWKPADIS